MRKVLVVIESDGREIIESPIVRRMLSAIEMAIAEDPTQATSVQVVAVRQRGHHMPTEGNPPTALVSPNQTGFL